jgi:nucleotide-binding universal stress UspA family protein
MKRQGRIPQGGRLLRLLFKNALVPVDGSENSRRALVIAIAIAKKYKARLFVLHVIPTPAYFFPLGVEGTASPYWGEYLQIADREAREMVDEGVLLARRHGVNATGHTIQYAPSVVEAIAGYASKKRVELIVIGTRGLSGFKKLLLGSVASGIMSHAHCAVLVVR